MNNSFSDASFWSKIGNLAGQGVNTVIRPAKLLYNCMADPDTPLWAKTIIISALTYFILPTDAVPDIFPGVGYTDDVGVMLGALESVNYFVKEYDRK